MDKNLHMGRTTFITTYFTTYIGRIYGVSQDILFSTFF